MTNKLPVTLLAHIDDVAVFQTAAFSSGSTFSDIISSSTVSDDNIVNLSDFDAEKKQSGSQIEASYGELNLGLHVNDEAATVLDNRMRLLATINEQVANLSLESKQHLRIKRLHWVNQVHGKRIHDIDATALSMEPMAADAMVSQQKGVGLAIMTADCVPIVLYQPASGQIAAIHAGWQGLACGVIQATVQHFTESGQIKAWIGVCISQQNYEVDSPVRDQLLAGCIENQLLTESEIDNFDPLYVISSDGVTKNDSQIQCLNNTTDQRLNDATVEVQKIKIDLPKLAADQLSAAGVTLDNSSPTHCSYADDHYYSYRRQTHLQQPATGRMALVIVRGNSI